MHQLFCSLRFRFRSKIFKTLNSRKKLLTLKLSIYFTDSNNFLFHAIQKKVRKKCASFYVIHKFTLQIMIKNKMLKKNSQKKLKKYLLFSSHIQYKTNMQKTVQIIKHSWLSHFLVKLYCIFQFKNFGFVFTHQPNRVNYLTMIQLFILNIDCC